MIRYKKIYCDAYGIDPGDFVPSEISDRPAVDIHHIHDRSDRIENLMAVTREEHDRYGDKKAHKYFLLTLHRDHMIKNRVQFDADWIGGLIEFYKHNQS